AKASQPVREAIAAAVEKGETVMKPVPAAVFRVNETDRGWVDAMCTPHPLATLTDKITTTGARERIAKKAYIRAKGYPSLPFDGVQERLKADAAWRVYELPCGRRHGRHAGSSDGGSRRGSIAALLRPRNERARPK